MTDVLPTPTGQRTEVEQLQADLARAKQETLGSAPLIQDSVDPGVELPRGLMHNGSWQTHAVVRELTGLDEEVLARVKTTLEAYDTVLALGTTRLGSLDLSQMPLAERQGVLQQLLIGERDQLYLGVVRATYGNTKTMQFTCRNCEEKQELILTLDEDFKPRIVEDVGLTEFTFITSKGDTIAYRPAVGSDQMEALSKKNASLAEQNTTLLSRCIKTMNGKLIVDQVQFARQLPMRDRQHILEKLIEHQPGVDMTITVDCVACREEQVIVLGWADLFQP